jgi:murein peptide amidase A
VARAQHGARQRPRASARARAGLRRASLRAVLAVSVALLLAVGGFTEAAPPLALDAALAVGATDSSGTPDASSTPDASATIDTSPSPTQPATHTTSVIGTSLRGRPIRLETFGTGSRRILLLAGVHGNEFGTPVAEAFLRYVRAHPSVVPSGTQLDVVARANPDGYAKRRRTNAHNVDINRNFPSRNWSRKRSRSGASPGVRPGSEPETHALLALLESRRYVRVVSLHSRGGVLDWDGPGGWTLARRMSKASRVRVHRLGAYRGSMGAFVPAKYRTPVITWELTSRALSGRVRAGLLASLR